MNTARLKSLLANLALHCASMQPHQRLACLFWPDSTDAQARTNLRHLLHELRTLMPNSERFLLADSQTLQWPQDAPFTLGEHRAAGTGDRGERSALESGRRSII